MTACPEWHAPDVPISPSRYRVEARTATGQEVDHLGCKKVYYRFENGATGAIEYEVLKVTRPVLSVGRMNLSGHTVTMAPSYAGISGARGREPLPLLRERNVFFLTGKVVRARGEVIFDMENEAGAPAEEVEAPEQQPQPPGIAADDQQIRGRRRSKLMLTISRKRWRH